MEYPSWSHVCKKEEWPVIYCSPHQLSRDAHIDGKIDVGDEIVAVNSKNLIGLKHSEAVHLLKTEGPNVVLTMRANPTLRGK